MKWNNNDTIISLGTGNIVPRPWLSNTNQSQFNCQIQNTELQIKTKCWSEFGFSEIIKQWKICHWLEQHCLDVVHQWYVWNYWLKMILVLEIWLHYVHLYLSQSMDFSMGSKWGKKSYKFQVGIEIVYCRFSQDYSFKLSYVAAKWYVKDQRPAFFMSLFRNLSAFKGTIVLNDLLSKLSTRIFLELNRKFIKCNPSANLQKTSSF